MKNIYQNQRFSNFQGATIFTTILLLLLLAFPPKMIGGTISGTFTTLPDCPEKLTAMCVDPATGIFYARGVASNAYYKYTISTDTWTALADDLNGVSGSFGWAWETGATVVNGKIYNAYAGSPDMGVYTIATNTWAANIPGPPDGIWSSVISSDGTNIYVCGGNGFSYFWKYLVASNTWISLTAPSSQYNDYGGLCYANGCFYRHVTNASDMPFDKYYIASDTWETLPSVPNVNGARVGAAFDGANYYCMGSAYETNLYSYDPGEQVWNSTLTLPWTIDDASLAAYQSSIYIIQGEGGVGFTKFTPNNPMLLNIEPALLRYTIGDAATQVTNTITASQNSGTNFASATVTVAGNFESGKDVLSFVNANGITGSWSSTTGVLTLTGTTTIANYQAALRTVKYYNSNASSTGLRRIEFKVRDAVNPIYSNIAVRDVAFPGPAVTTSLVRNISASDATTGGVVIDDGGYTIYERGVCYNTTGAPTIADFTSTDMSTGTGCYTNYMVNLIDGTSYHVRAYAKGSPAGKAPTGTTYGDEKDFVASDFYVNAGPDATTCGGEYALTGNARGIDAVASTYWSTSGDGYFANEMQLETTYYPGTNDNSTGFTTLTLAATFADPATTTLSDDMTLTISGTVGGAISPTIGGVCAGTNSTLLTLENYIGTIEKWQYSANGTDAWTDIAASTASTYTATDLSASRYYRVVVKNGTCDAANSELALINAEVPPVSGSLAKTPDVATVFDGTYVSAVLTPGTGGKETDALLYRTKTGAVWSAPLAYTSGTTIATTGKTGVNIYTWREFTYCDPGSSIVSVDWAVELKPSAGTIAASQTICYNTTPAAFTSTLDGTGIGTISYEWQTNASGSYINISGATLATYQAPTLTATTSYQRRTVATTGGTDYYSDYTTPVTITVQSAPTAGAIAADQTICYGTAPAWLTSTAGTGLGTISYEWQTNASGSYLNISGATAATYQPPSLTSTRSYQRRTVSTLNGNVCYSDYTTPVVITVQTVPLSFPLGTAQTICYNTAPVPLTSDAGTGSGTISYEWQTNAFFGFYLDISGATDVSYQPPALTATTSYKKRTVSTLNGRSCYSVYSNVVTITVQSEQFAGTIGPAQTICYNTTPALLSSADTKTPGFVISYEWQTNASGSYADISGATAISYQPPALTATTSYKRRTVSTMNGNVCYSDYTTPVTITVQSTPTAGAIAADQTICYNTAPALLTSTDGTGSGTISYEWQTNASGSYATIGGATSATYQPPSLTATTSYQRRTVSTLNGNVCYSAYTTAVTITVQTTPTAGAIATAQTICSNTAPALLTSTDGTGSGTISYEWQTNASGSYLNISGATDATYQPPTLTATTSYKRRTVSTLNTNACYSDYTTPVTITIDPVSVGGTVGTSTHVCTGTNSTLLTLTGKTGVVQRWQYSTNSGTGWTDLNSATNTTYTATNLTVTTDYRAVVKSGTCPEDFSVAATITVDPTSNGGNVSGSSIVCYGTNSTTLTLYGQTGNVVKWQYTSNGGYNWYDIPGSTNTTYTATDLIITTSFRAVVQSGVCNATPGGYANVTVRPNFVAPVASGVQTICWNTTSGELSATAASGGTGPYDYQWQMSYDESIWENIENETSLTLAPGDLYETTYYRLMATDLGTPSCSNELASNTITVTVRDPFTASELSIASNRTSTCYNTAPGLMTATPTLGGSGPPFTYQWQMKTTGSWTNVGTNSLTYQPGSLTTTAQFRMIAFDGGIPSCGSVFSLNDLTITIDPLPAADAGSDQTICLNESAQIGADAVSGSTYSWSSVPEGYTSTLANPTVSPAVTTTYTVVETVTATGCVQSNSVTVTVNPLPAAVAGADRDICLNQSTILGADAVSGNTYSWSSEPSGFTSTEANPTVSPVVTTTYTVVETITATGCNNTHSVTVTVNPLPVAEAGSDRDICLNESANIGAAAVTGSTYAWSSVPAGYTSTLANPTVSPTVTTTYTVVETITATGCTNTNSVTITVNPLPAALAGANRAICLNESTTIGSVAIAGNTYSWTSFPAGFTSALSAPTVSPTVTTTYTVTETITLTGCTNTHSVTVTVNPLPAAIAGDDRAICLNESTTLGAASKIPTNSFSWTSNPAGFTSTLARPIVSPTVTTTYTVVETILLTGCSNTNSVTVTVNPLPDADAGADRPICLNESTAIGAAAVAGNTYSWTSVPSGFTSTDADPTVSPTVTTTYTVVETITATGCNNTNSVTVTVNPLPSAVAGADRDMCLSAGTTLGAAAVSGSTYSWTSDPVGFTSTLADPTVSPAVNTTYTVVETITATGCNNTNSVTVTVKPLPDADAGEDRDICLNESTTIGEAAVTGNTYSWSSVPSGFTSALAAPTVSPTVTTTYTVVETITATGCTNTNSVTVTVNPLPDAIAGDDRAICLNESTTLGGPPILSVSNTFSWTSVPVGFTSTLDRPVVSPTETTTYTVVETITLTGCTNTHSVTVTVNPLPAAIAGADREICLNESTTLGAPALKGISNTYSWTSVPVGFTSTLARPTVSPSVTTTYTVVETITLTGCTNTNSVTVTVNPLPAADAGADRDLCLNDDTTIGAAAVAGNTYSWTSVPAGFTSTEANPTVGPTVTTTYTVVETITATGCNDTHSVTVTVKPLPVAAAGSDRPICLNESTTIGAAAVSGSTYSWSSEPSGFSSALADPIVSPTETTTYTVTETITATGCHNTNSVTVTVNPLPVAAAGDDRDICLNGSTTLGADAVTGSTYSWSSVPAGFTSALANPLVSPTVTTTYTVVETITLTGCTNTNSVVVTVNPLPGANAGSASTICYGWSTSIGAAAVTGNTYSWTSFPVGFTSALAAPTVSPTETTTYTLVETITATGCTNSNSVEITVRPEFIQASCSVSSQRICYNNAPAAIVATAASGGSGGYTYQWQYSDDGTSGWNNIAGATTLTYSPGILASTIYYRILTSDIGTPCCGTIVAGNTVTINVNEPLYPSVVTINPVQTAICLNATPGLLTATEATGGTGPFSYQWQRRLTAVAPWTNIGPNAIGNTTYQPGPVTVNTYYRVIAKDVGIPTCGSTFSNVIYITTLPIPAAAAGSVSTVCAGFSANIGAAPVAGSTFSWSSVPAGFTSTLSNPTVSPTVTTTYTVEETITATGCKNSNSVTITVNPLPAAEAGSDRDICLNESTTIGAAAVAGNTYSWTSVPAGYTSTDANPSVSPTVTTTYTVVEIITATGCTDTHSVTVTVNPLPEALAGADRAICLNESTTLGGPEVLTPANSFSWTSVPAGFTSTLARPVVSPGVTTTYTVVETITATGCANSNSVTVTVNPLPDAVAGDDRDICLNESTTLGAPPLKNGLNSFSWTSVPVGFTSTLARPTVSPTVTTTYTVVETILATGCSNTHSVTVTVNPLPDAVAGSDRAICLNESTTLGAAAVTGSTYSWTSVPPGYTSALADPSVSPAVTTTYTVVETITATGCNNTNSVTVTVNPLPDAFAGTDRDICLNESTTIGAAAVTGSTYAWSSIPAGFTSTSADPSVSPSVTTTYIVVETITATGCTNTNGVTVTVNPLPAAEAGSDRDICLNESTTIGASAVAGNAYSWTSVPAGYTSTDADPSVSPTVTTTYTVVETITATGCTNTNSVTVTVNPLPDAVAGSDRAICLNESTTIGASAVAGNTYSWTSVPAGYTSTVADPSVSPGVTTTYTVVETITATGCTNSNSVTVTVNPLPDAVAGDDRDICLNESTTLGAPPLKNGLNSFSWTSVPVGFTSTLARPTVSPTVTTTYTVVETILATGCSNTHSVTVTVNPLPDAVAGSDRAICLNESTTLGAAAVTGSTYSWSSVPSGYTSTDAEPSVSPAVTTTYTVVETITATGCTNTHSVTVTVNPLPDAVAGTDRDICLNESTTIGGAAVSGNTYSWTSVPAGFTSTSSDPSVSPGVTTTYTVTETITATGCTNTNSVTVTVNPLPDAVAGSDRDICLNASTTIGAAAVAGNTCSWTSVPAGYTSTDADPSVSPTVTTTYTVVETITATGCNNTNSVTVTVNPLPDAVAGTDRAICLNESTTIGASAVAGNTYSWTSVPAGYTSTVADPSVSPTVTTTYTVVETITATGCNNTNSVTVTVNPLPEALAGDDRDICLHESTTLGAPPTLTPGNSFSWSSVPAGFTSILARPTVSPTVTTTYTVVETITATGCTNTNSVTVTVNPLPDAVAGTDRAICLNESTTIGAAAVAGNTYSWTSVPSGYTSTDANPSVSPTVTTTYTVVETITATGCNNTNSVTVTVNPLPDAVAGTDTEICLNESTTIGGAAVSGNTYSWTSVPAGFTSTSSDPSVSPGVTTTYTVTETITATGCTNTNSVTVTVNPLPDAVAGSDRDICLNASTTIGAAAVAGNTYSWTSVPAGYTSTDADPSVSPAVTTTYTVTETITATGCTNTNSVTVTVNPLPEALAGDDRAICLNESTTLGGPEVLTPANSFSWTSVPAGFTSTLARPVASPLVTTTYTVVETITATGCTNTHSVTVTVNPLPAAVAGSDRDMCLNAGTTLGAAAVTGSTYSWTSDPVGYTSTLADPTVNPAVNTTYTVTETITATGCVNTNSVTVTVNPLPDAVAGTDRAICLNESTTIGASAVSGNTCSWTSVPAGYTSTLADPSVSPAVTTTYTVVETITATGCTNSNSVTVTVNPLPDAVAGADRDICLNESTTIGASAVAGNTYSWTSFPPGFTSALAAPTVSPTETTTYTVVETITATGCTNTNSVTVTVNPLPVAAAGADRDICLNESTTIGAAAVTGSTYSWTSVPAGYTSTDADPSVSPTQTTTYTVVETITATGCNSTNSVTVTVKPIPVLSSTLAPAAICSGTTFDYTAACAISGATYAWSRATVSGITEPGTSGTGDVSEVLSNTTTLPIEVTYVYVTSANGCSNAGENVVVTVNPIPVLSSTLTPAAICNNATFGYTAASATAGATFAWSRATITGITQAGASGTGNVSEVLSNTTTEPVDVTYVYTTTANGCSNTFQDVVVSVNPTAVLSSTLTPAAINSAVTFVYTATSATAGATFAWSRATIAGITQPGTSGSGNVSEKLTNTSTTPKVVTYMYTTTINGCSNAGQAVTVTVYPTGDLSSTLTPGAVCSAAPFIYTATSTTPGATFAWTRATLPGIMPVGASGTGNVFEVLINTTPAPIVVTYVYTTTANGYSNTPQNVVVTINPTPVLSTTLTPAAICSGSTFTYVPASATSGSTFGWSRATKPGILQPGTSGTGSVNEVLTNTTSSAINVTYLYTTTANGCSASPQQVVVKVNPALTVSVTIAANTSEPCVGATVNFTATPVNGGTTPAYQWYVDNVIVTGATSSTWSFTATVNASVTCVLTSSASPCSTGSPATSNTVVITVPEICPTTTVIGTLGSGETQCYNATQTITVAGSGTTFVVNPGGHATMIAGVNILYLPGTKVEPAGYMLGKIYDGAYCGKQSASIVTVFTQENEPAAVALKSTFKLYPNPTTGKFTIEQSGVIYEKVKVEIYSILGGKVMTGYLTGETKHEFSIADFPAGVYFVKVFAGSEAETIKLIKSN